MLELGARGLRLYTVRRGERGPLVLFVPGAGASHVGWGMAMRAVADVARAVAYDPRGTGRTEGDGREAGAEVLAADLAALLDALGEPAHVVAHSLGTRVALGAAARLPGRVASLFLFAPWYGTDPYMEHRQDMVQEVVMRGDRRVAAQTLLWLLTSRTLQVEEPERFRQYLEGMFLGPGATPWDVVVRQLLAGREEPISERELDAVRCPVRVLVAEGDRMVDPAASERLAARLGASVVRLAGPRASHLAHVEMPDAFAAALRAWLAEVAAA
jgi:aminoacrylate hydrolase